MSSVDKNKPATWKAFRKGMCDNCLATCCTMPVEVTLEDLQGLGLITEDEINDSPKKIFKRLSREGYLKSYRASTGLFMLEQQSNGDCIFLDSQRRCKVYDKRPSVCRKFPTQMGLRVGYCPALPFRPQR